jgi:hypothetical protein
MVKSNLDLAILIAIYRLMFKQKGGRGWKVEAVAEILVGRGGAPNLYDEFSEILT